MYKDELILLHQVMAYLTRFMTCSGVPDSFFKRYKDLGISPHHIHRTKDKHKYAIFLLAHGISRALTKSGVVPERLVRKMGEMVERSGEECYRIQD
jgi:hypothetical protein